MDTEEYKRYKEIEYRVCKLEYTVNGLSSRVDELEWKMKDK